MNKVYWVSLMDQYGNIMGPATEITASNLEDMKRKFISFAQPLYGYDPKQVADTVFHVKGRKKDDYALLCEFVSDPATASWQFLYYPNECYAHLIEDVPVAIRKGTLVGSLSAPSPTLGICNMADAVAKQFNKRRKIG